MYRDSSGMGNRLAPQRDEVASQRELEEKRKKARQEAMMKRLSSKSAVKYGSGY